MRQKGWHLVVLIVGLALAWLLFRSSESPKEKIIWSVAVARPLQGRETRKTAQLYVATNGAIYITPDWERTWWRRAFPDNQRFVSLAADSEGTVAG
jgi:hypothetical protein